MSLINEKKDFGIIANLIPSNASVIDVGCNDGSLLEYLKKHKNIDGRGMEIDQKKVQLCLAKGISVIEGDADKDLYDYPDKIFDYSILTYTLQATKSPKTVMQQLVRISKKAIISFPNFGHWKIGASLLLNRKMPVSEKLSYSWHETPNLHFCTINDFIDLCDEINITIEKSGNLSNKNLDKFHGKNFIDSYFNEVGLFLVSKD
ncbi:methionine biosynthesis protein MetW [Pelagibacteraceae bacterium]|nr:methionine biosynthesis protein MetW [Pelagibacteraceae bacterium]|tara:strand:- start:1008 stop:1619 length:612 start_codon:yes stop_codon:yes gene_type:complete